MIIYKNRRPVDCDSSDFVGVVGENKASIQKFYLKGISDDSVIYSIHLRFADGSVNSINPDSVTVDENGTKIVWIVKKNDIFCHGYFQLQIEGANTDGLNFQTEIITLFADESIPIEDKAYENPNSETLALREQAFSALEEIREQNIQIEHNASIINESNILEKANKTDVENALSEKENNANKVTDQRYIVDSRVNYPSIEYLEGYYYSAEETEDLLSEKANASEVNAELNLKANIEDVNSELDKKANVSDVEMALSEKADKSEVTSSLNEKASDSELQIAKAKISEMEQLLNAFSLAKIGQKIISGKIKKILIIGDSTTDGYGGSGYNGSREYKLTTNTGGYCWVNVMKKYLKENYDCTVINAGVYGGSLGTQVQYVNDKNLIPPEENIDLVISIASGNNCKNMAYFKKYLLSATDKLKSLVENVIVVANLPTDDIYDASMYESFSVYPQDIAEQTYRILYGNTMYIPMYDLFVRYCEDNNIDMSSTFYDGRHPNDLGYLIVFKLMLQQLGLYRNYYSDFSVNGSWWIGTEQYSTLAYSNSAVDATATSSTLSPLSITEGLDTENKTTGLSGKTVTKIKIPFSTTGKITIGKVDMSNYGKGIAPQFVSSQQYTVTKTGENEIFLSNLVLGENETLAIGASGDTATFKYIGNTFIKEGGFCTFHTASAYKSGTVSTLSLICSIYTL